MSQRKRTQKNFKKEKKRAPQKKITESYLHNAGLYYLGRFAASTAQFKKVMTRKIDRSCQVHADQNREDCLELLNKIICRFEEVGLLDDEVYTRSNVQSMRRRGLSARMIQAKLQSKGLSRDIIEEELTAYEGAGDSEAEILAALRLARRKKIGPYAAKEPNLEITQEKAMAMLARAGFSYDIAQKILAMSWAESEEISESAGW